MVPILSRLQNAAVSAAEAVMVPAAPEIHSAQRVLPPGGHNFGTAPVFLAAISTILGAIMFLRFGYAVGHLGLSGAVLLILLGHLVTIPTAMAVSEIATNRRVEGGGEYFMISRSFGSAIGGAIGVSLYLSQAVSVAFYMIAFAEAFRPILDWINASYGVALDPRVISLPATVALLFVILKRGADLGVRVLWVVVTILAVSLTLFFLGKGPEAGSVESLQLTNHIENPHSFALVFAICFPAFTGMTAGVGLSGDLKNPGRSIPLGTLLATAVGMIMYLALVFKLAANALPQDLAANQLIMSDIALWGPIIPIGLAAATLSSALGSILIAPRTLQALARDRVLPSQRLSDLLSRGYGRQNEPVAATLVSGLLALAFVLMGDVDTVSQVISMFFMVTYGSICSISFLEHFAGNPSYRPSFRSRWYISLLGAIMCFMMMFQMSPAYALFSLTIMFLIYQGLGWTRKGERSLSSILQGVMFQLTRRLQISIQKARAGETLGDWRPSILAITRHSEDRLGQFDLLRWLCHQQGFGQFVQYVEGKLSRDSEALAGRIAERLIQRTEVSKAGIYVDTMIAPSFDSALSSIVQMPGVSGLPNNTVLFEYATGDGDVSEVTQGAALVESLGLNVAILRSTPARFGYRRHVHIWLTEDDYSNAPLMILLAYILVGHPEWHEAEIDIFACYRSSEMECELGKLHGMIAEGRLPVSTKNVTAVPYDGERGVEAAAVAMSGNADLLILGLPENGRVPWDSADRFTGLKDILFVRAAEYISIS
ncbi:MAG: amino acid permease [Bryobacteraceae bacterium]